MTSKRIAKAAVLAAMLVLGLAAPASADTVSEGRLTIELDRGLRSSLHREGATLRGLRPAVGRASLINLPVEGGGVEISGKGRLLTAGGIRFAAKGRRATFRELVLDTAFGTLSAKLGGRRLALATVSGLSSERHGFAVQLGLRRLTLTRSAAAAVDASLGAPGLLRAGQALGSVTAVARFEQLHLIDGRAYLSFAQGLADKLESLKVETESLGGGWLHTRKPPAPVLADTAGEIALDLSSGSFASDDGFTLTQEGTGRRLAVHDVEFDLDTHVVRAAIDPTQAETDRSGLVALATFVFPVVHKNAYTGEISTPNSPAIMSAEFATALNQAFADPSGAPGLFVAGEPFGEVALGLKVHGVPRG